jgi:hypothetical protein
MLLSCLAASKAACTGSGAPVLLLLLLLAMPAAAGRFRDSKQQYKQFK